jgi:hypothetical protein
MAPSLLSRINLDHSEKGVYQDVCLRVSIDYEANSQRRAVGPDFVKGHGFSRAAKPTQNSLRGGSMAPSALLPVY